MYYPGDQRCERLMKILSKRQLSICFLLSYVVFVFWLTVGSRSVRIQQPCFELFKSFNDWFAGDKEKTDLVKMTENLFEKYTPSLEERNITLTVKGDYIKKVNKNLFANALENLVSNSVKYVDDGGEINVVGNKNYFTILNSVEELPDKKGEELWETFDIHKIKASIEYEDGEKKKFGVYIY